jgi:hypothetical protein
VAERAIGGGTCFIGAILVIGDALRVSAVGESNIRIEASRRFPATSFSMTAAMPAAGYCALIN